MTKSGDGMQEKREMRRRLAQEKASAISRKAYRMRIRRILPSMTWNMALAQCGWFERYLYVQLLMIADGKGRFVWNPEEVRRTLFPYDQSLTAEALSDGARMLAKAGMLRFYRTDDALGTCVQIENFKTYSGQGDSALPAPPED